MKRNTLITAIIITAIILLAVYINYKKSPETPEETAKCIGENSIIYTQLGCHACEEQEKLFGENYKYLNIIDCFFETDKCSEIKVTPTWLIKGKTYEGLQSIEKLKEMTGC